MTNSIEVSLKDCTAGAGKNFPVAQCDNVKIAKIEFKICTLYLLLACRILAQSNQ
jgi:hypothetical protein